MCTHVCTHGQRSEDISLELVFYFDFCMEFRDQIQVVRLDGKCFYPLNYGMGPAIYIYFNE